MLDLHVDFIIQQRLFRYNALRAHSALVKGQPLFYHADIPRMREAGYLGACLGIHFFPWESERGWREMNAQIDYLDRITQTSEDVLRVRTAQDWALAREQGKLALAPGVEGAHMLNGKIERVEELARRGVAYLTLTHFSTNMAAATGWGRGASETQGLSSFGKELVIELERNDVRVDLAHVNTPGVLDTCAIAKKPVFCTHTGCRALNDHPRNITDEEIDAIASTGGVIGIIFGPFFLAGKMFAPSDCVLDHVEYVVDRVGIEHVALGSDFDGWLATIPNDMKDCRDVIKILDGLKRRGFTEEQIEAITHENALRVLRG